MHNMTKGSTERVFWTWLYVFLASASFIDGMLGYDSFRFYRKGALTGVIALCHHSRRYKETRVVA
jgi:hypothetical protein